MASHHSLSKPVDYFTLNLRPSGINWNIPLIGIVFLLPIFQPLLSLFAKAATYTVFGVVSGTILAFLYAWGFLHPRRRLEKFDRRGWSLHVPRENLRRTVLINSIPWILFICFLWLVPEWFIYHLKVPVYVRGIELLVSVAIVLDILDRVRMFKRADNCSVKIAEIHDVYDAQMIKNHLEAEGVRCHVQGFYHRSLLYFFGPYIEMSVMVPEGKREQAEALIRDYYGGLGLMRA